MSASARGARHDCIYVCVARNHAGSDDGPIPVRLLTVAEWQPEGLIRAATRAWCRAYPEHTSERIDVTQYALRVGDVSAEHGEHVEHGIGLVRWQAGACVSALLWGTPRVGISRVARGAR